jgi:hypothetical protein
VPEPQLAGQYAGIYDYFASALRNWQTGQDSTIQLLGCRCGELGCWPLEARMTVTDQHVTWSQFVQPYRRDTWSYEGFGPFVFGRTEFEAELARALENR